MINTDYLKNLNKAQKEAVLHLDGPLLIVAGAGMGIDSGLPDYRGPNGLWNNPDFIFQPARDMNLTYEDLSYH